MEKIEEFIDELRRFDVNVKKQKNRVYTLQYKTEKLIRLELIKEELDKYSEALDKSERESLVIELQKLYDNAIILVHNLNIKDCKEQVKGTGASLVEGIMAHFDITVVSKNLQVFKGSYEALEDFLVQTELLHDLLRTEDREIYIKYVFNFKLTAQVRSIIGRANRPVTFSDLKDALITAYPNPNTLQQVLSEFGTLRQGNADISSFREKISLLSDQLSKFEIESLENPTQREKDVIYKMGENMALNVFMKGVNQEFQDLLIASSPKTLNEAVEKCITAERDKTTSSIFRIGNPNVKRNSRGNNPHGYHNYRGYSNESRDNNYRNYNNESRDYNPRNNRNNNSDYRDYRNHFDDNNRGYRGHTHESQGNNQRNYNQQNGRFHNSNNSGYRNDRYREDGDNFNRNRNGAANNTDVGTGRGRQGN